MAADFMGGGHKKMINVNARNVKRKNTRFLFWNKKRKKSGKRA
jgi:hypothetical protein